MTRRFAVKKEIRSLGIDLCNPERVIGAVVRGGLYIDGILAFSSSPKRWNVSIAHQIVRTRFFPELKLIMTHDPGQRLDFPRLERMTGLTIIDVRTGNRTGIGFRGFAIDGGEIQVRSSLDSRILEEVLERTCSVGSLPEPLRVAHLVAKSRFLGKKRPFWANK